MPAKDYEENDYKIKPKLLIQNINDECFNFESKSKSLA